MFFTIVLLIFSVILLFSVVILIIWWKKYGKSMFLLLDNLKNIQNPSQNLNNLNNLTDFYQKMGNFGGQMADFDPNFMDFIQKNIKKGKK